MITKLSHTGADQPTKISFVHESLGEIVGWERGNDIAQFRGLPFASIPGRFRQSVICTSLPQVPFNATSNGPTCPHPPQEYWKYWEAELPEELPRLQPTKTDELECLNLSITIPNSALSEQSKLPVFVFVHGGAFVGGSHAIQLHGREVFDPAGLVRYSMQMGKDIIAVGINYRVGPLGFLASKELTAFNKSHGEAVGNYGLHDQRHALEWLHRFVAGFGGDPERITIQGTSAGGASCHFQTLFPNRKFKRAILASGTGWSIGAIPEEVAQETFDRLRDAIASEEDALDAVRNVHVDTLNKIIPYGVCNPLIDDHWVTKDAILPPDHQTAIPAEVMVGAALREDDIAEVFLRDMATWQYKSDREAWRFMQAAFASNNWLRSPIFPFDNPALLQAYGLDHLLPIDPTNPKLEISKNAEAWAALIGHVFFNFPSYLLAERLAGHSEVSKVWLYHFEARNPYPASHSRDMAHHGVNDLLLFNIAPDQIPQTHLEAWEGAVDQTRRSWIEFVNGESPWSSVEAGESLGPLFVFRDGLESASAKDLEEGIGKTAAQQWHLVRESII